jgi:uncharacterized protein YjbJ (UPF0337 family)
MKLVANPASQSLRTDLFPSNVHRRNTMSSTGDKVKGMANEAVGNVKQGVGKVTDNDKLRAEGKLQEKKGEAQQAVGKAKDAIKKGVDKASRLEERPSTDGRFCVSKPEIVSRSPSRLP